MFTKRLLFLTNHRLVSVVWKRNQALDCQIFPLNDAGRLAFSRHVAELPSPPTYLLTELVEEDFRADTIPHVVGRYRKAILDRKLSQIFRATPYRLGLVQGREQEGRHDDRVLYTAITNPDLIRPWIDLLTELGAPLAGVYSAPLLSTELLRMLKVNAEHVLLVSVEAGGGLRQSYFQQGHIKFSRMTPVSEIRREELAGFMADEVGKTWQYLDSLRYFTRANALQVIVLAHADDQARIIAARPPISQVHYNTINIQHAAMRIGLTDELTSSDATPIFIQLLGRHAPRGQFATRDETRGMRTWQQRHGLYMASAAVLFVSALWSGWNVYEASGQQKQIERIEAQTKMLTQQQMAALQSRPPTAVSPAVMRDSVTLYEALIKTSPSPTQVMRELSQVLALFPAVRVQQIAWGLSNDPNAVPRYTPTTNPVDGPLKSSRNEPAANPAPNPGQQADASGALNNNYQVAIIEADIYPFDGDYRRALMEMDRFEQALKSLPGANASIMARPVDLGSNATLSGRAAGTNNLAQARFTVKIVMELAKT
jgi:hypothetical protein